MYELGMSPAVAAVLDGGPSGSVEAPRLGAREGFGIGRLVVSRSAWDADGGPPIYTHTLTSRNGRGVTGHGYTPEAAEEDALKAWLRGEG